MCRPSLSCNSLYHRGYISGDDHFVLDHMPHDSQGHSLFKAFVRAVSFMEQQHRHILNSFAYLGPEVCNIHPSDATDEDDTLKHSRAVYM
jgi:hypothetical protein